MFLGVCCPIGKIQDFSGEDVSACNDYGRALKATY